ncbi:MAG: hypothetical protein JXA94_05470 [Parachlamydiales bacterium]|nr:hypothetical protein [Parachlamydiales bacterium]
MVARLGDGYLNPKASSVMEITPRTMEVYPQKELAMRLEDFAHKIGRENLNQIIIRCNFIFVKNMRYLLEVVLTFKECDLKIAIDFKDISERDQQCLVLHEFIVKIDGNTDRASRLLEIKSSQGEEDFIVL